MPATSSTTSPNARSNSASAAQYTTPPTPSGQLLFNVLAMVAEFEADLVGLWHAGGHTSAELADLFSVARSTVYRQSNARSGRRQPPDSADRTPPFSVQSQTGIRCNRTEVWWRCPVNERLRARAIFCALLTMAPWR